MERIPVAGPWVTQKEIDYVADAVTRAWYSNAGLYNDRFEKAFAEYLGIVHAISLPSCTSAIHLSLLALGIGPGDEVVVPDITWIATSAPISYVGATPIFADIDERTWCLSAESLESCITPRTRAVIPVDLYGNIPDMDAVIQVAEKHDIAVIEDAAEAIGSKYKNKLAGIFGNTGVFSFHGSKTLTTGEGGMLVTNDVHLYQRVLSLRDHGRTPGDKMFNNLEIAHKYKMGALQAALGLAQLERIGELLRKKREIFSWYQKGLSEIEGLSLNYESHDTFNSYWMVTVIFLNPRLKKELVIQRLSDAGIDSRPFFHPLSSLPAYKHLESANRARAKNEISYRLSPFGVNLPSALNLTEKLVGRVCTKLIEIIHEFS